METLAGKTTSLEAVENNPLSVFFFLAPECPLCENYALTITQLRERFPAEEVAFYGIFAGYTYSHAEIAAYLARFDLPVKALRDPDYRLTQFLQARVTPEAVLVDANGTVQYQGKIDNWIATLGKKRLQVSRHYLADAIESVRSGQPVAIPQTTAVGCLIE